MTREAWLSRRALGFGASDVPVLLIAAGLRSGDDAPKYITERTRHVVVGGGIEGPELAVRLYAEKAGIVRPLKAGRAAAIGTKRERELLAAWRERLEHGQFYCDEERQIITSSVRHADVAMRCAMPWVDRHCPRLVATLDGWAEDILDDEVVLECKCTASERRELPWIWEVQVQAQLAVSGGAWGLVICGELWAAEWVDVPGPIRAWPVQRDEKVIADIRGAVERGWLEVERLRAAAEKEEAA
jgi:predicted phage-related endonuclease